MSGTKPVNVICTALFVGIILTFMFYFGVSAIIQSPDGQNYGEVVRDMSFERFSGAFYCDDQMLSRAASIEYSLFGSIGSTDIIIGDDGFLFDAGTDENGYNYLRDYIGDTAFYDSELEALANIMLLRRLAYKNNGVEYLMVVIPNSQTVYSENMPHYMGDISENTRLSQLTRYINEREYGFFLNTSDVLNAAKENRRTLYNNTENSLNSVGEWYIYDAVRKYLEENYGITGNKVELSALELYERNTDGKELARRAGLPSVIQNNTISLSNQAETLYSLSSYYGTMVRTSIKNENRAGEGPESAILLEFTDDWDRIQLLPYFSNTYNDVAYKTNHLFSSLVVDNLKPSVVVQFIHEYELYDMIDSGNIVTYNAGLRLTIDDKITSQPLLTSMCPINSHTVCIAGETEDYALMTVSVNGRPVKQERAIGNLFFLSVDLGRLDQVTVNITAQVDGKETSAPIQLALGSDPSVKAKNVVVGNNSQLYQTDYSWLTKLTDSQIESLRSDMTKKVNKVSALTGKDTEYIYVIVPDKLALYGDDAPDSLDGTAIQVAEYRGLIKNVRESAGMTVLDLDDELKKHAALGRLYCQTDELWTGFGSYVGYNALMSHIAGKFDSVKVHGLIDFSWITEENVGGELVTKLGLDGAVISETYLTVSRSFQPKARFEHSGGSGFDLTQAFISYMDDESLPTAIVARDAYGTEMLENMAEHFSRMIVLREGEYTINDELIAEIKPDYIITIRCNGELS